MPFIESIGEYEDGEKVDVLINLDMLCFVRTNSRDASACNAQFGPNTVEGDNLKLCEPYAIIRRKIMGSQERTEK